MKYSILVLTFLLCISIQAQEKTPLSIFDNLIGRTWTSEGSWENGSTFKQEITFTYDLDKSIVVSNSDGFVDEKQTVWGHRNHGIRQWDKHSHHIKFWEYDVFGGVTTGKVFTIDDNIYYQYNYGSGEDLSVVTDCWKKIDDHTYAFKVGVFEDEQWKNTYLSTIFKALPEFIGEREALDKILEATKTFSATYMKGDHNLLSTYYTTNGKIMPGGSNIIEGRKAIAERWELPEGSRILHHEVRPEKIEIIDNTAIDYGYYKGKSQDAAGNIYPFSGKYVIIWKKIAEQWLIDIDIWNSVKP